VSGNQRFVDSTVDGTAPRDRSEPKELVRQYVVVFESDSSQMFELPADGEVRVGRGEDVPLRLRETAISRHHAVIRTAAGQATVIDEGSQNATRVNGERVVGARALASGDVISICAATLVYHASAPAVGAFTILELPAFRERLAQELERARAYHRPLIVVAAALGSADRPRVALALARRLRMIDVAGWSGADQLLVLMPERTADEAFEAAGRLLATLQPVAPTARAGFAIWPADGIDVDTLLEAARTSAFEAPPSTVASATRAFRTLEVGDHSVVVADPTMIRLYELVERLARSRLPVLIWGETGSGKELAARAIHEWSNRRDKPLIAINCAAITETLIESELFGHEKGAFSGAVGTKIGPLERAAGGTVFLDEVGELSAGAQAKLLRVLEHKVVTRVGDVHERAIDIRVVAATNRNLEIEVSAGRFRRDLYFRLSGGMIWVPPLRDRKREIAILAQRFLEEACERMQGEVKVLSEDALRALSLYDWPGNIRELHNLMEYAAAAVEEAVVEARDLEPRLGRQPGDVPSPEPRADSNAQERAPQFRPIDEEIRELEYTRMHAALRATGGHQRRAAELIAMPLRTFQTKAKLYGLSFDTHHKR
jgi:two-component system response regulator AtoC